MQRRQFPPTCKAVPRLVGISPAYVNWPTYVMDNNSTELRNMSCQNLLPNVEVIRDHRTQPEHLWCQHEELERLFWNIPPGVIPPPVLAAYPNPLEFLNFHVIVPPRCQEGGFLHPCPLLTLLHDRAGDSIMGLMLHVCYDSLGAILLIPKTFLAESDKAPKGYEADLLTETWGDFTLTVRPVVESVLVEYAHLIDPNRIWLYGQSMGGEGALWAAVGSADIFHLVFAASPRNFLTKSMATMPFDEMVDRLSEAWTNSTSENKTRRLKTFNVYYGERDCGDPDQPLDFGLFAEMVQKVGMPQAGVKVKVRLYKEQKHDTWLSFVRDDGMKLWRGEYDSAM